MSKIIPNRRALSLVLVSTTQYEFAEQYFINIFKHLSFLLVVFPDTSVIASAHPPFYSDFFWKTLKLIALLFAALHEQLFSCSDSGRHDSLSGIKKVLKIVKCSRVLCLWDLKHIHIEQRQTVLQHIGLIVFSKYRVHC